MEIKHDVVQAGVQMDASLFRKRSVSYEKSAKTSAKAVGYCEVKCKTQNIIRNLSILSRI